MLKVEGYMRVKNIFRMQEWEITQFLKVVLLFQVLISSIIGLGYLGFQIPILRSIVGFIYLTFVPGILILRVLKLKDLSNIESLLYTVGLSLATLMFVGFFMNLTYPLLCVAKPLSLGSTIITISVLVILLSILAYIKDDRCSKEDYLNIENINSVLFLLLIPVLTILGTCLVNFYSKNFLTIILLIIISLISFLGLSKHFKPALYPLTLFIVSISLLYHNALISMNIWGWDINAEYYLANLVLKNAYWNSHIYSDVNSMLSVVILAPMYSLICNIGLTWVFKIVYPFIFSMVPLGLYLIIKRYTTPKISFLSVFYFMAVYMFYCDMLQLARQEVAELFFVLLLLLMVNKKMDMKKGFLLFTIFGISLIISHYGLSYIYLFYITLTTLIVYLISTKFFLKHFSSFPEFKNKTVGMLGSKFTIFFVIMLGISCILWYTFTSNSSNLHTIQMVFYNILIRGFGNILNVNNAQGLSIASSTESLFFHQVTKILFLISQALIFVGLMYALFNKKSKFKTEYLTFSVLSFFVAVFSLILPYFASALQTSRFYQITLLLLSPFFVIGAIFVLDIASKILKIKIERDFMLKVTALFLSIFLLFNVGVVYEFSGEIQPSMALIALNNFDYTVYNSQEVSGAEWLSTYDKNSAYICTDYYKSMLLMKYFGKDSDQLTTFKENQNLSQGSLIYLGTINIKENKVSKMDYSNNPYGKVTYFNLPESNFSEIYDNGGSKVHLTY